jgi:hypothetical protein
LSTKKRTSSRKVVTEAVPQTPESPSVTLAPLRTAWIKLDQVTKFAIGVGGLIVAILVTMLMTTNQQESSPSSSLLVERSLEKLSGQVKLNEVQLRGAAALLATPVYWIGPIDGFQYVLDASINGLILVRYVPIGTDLSDQENLFTAVGTYSVADAFEVTKARGEATESTVGLINEDGAAVFYDVESPLNAFLAYPNLDIQIEVFDPRPSVAIEAAKGAGIVKLIN